MRGQRNIYHANGCQKKVEVTILISDFKAKIITRDKGHYIIKRTIQQEVTIVNIYAPNIEATKYIKTINNKYKGINR